MKKTNKLLAALALAIGFSVSAKAAVITIQNYNFETGDLTGWGSGGQAAVINWDPRPAYCGNYVGFLSSVGGNGVVAQNNLATVQANYDYKLTIDGAAASWEPTGQITVQLSGNGVNGLATQTFNLIGGGGGGNAANWNTYSLHLSASVIAANPTWVGQSLGVGIWTPNGVAVEFDNVALTATAIPEPGTATMLGLGLAGFLGARRRRARA
jgi:hypothetical protein